ncbi:MAG: hypothetical protein AB1656_14855 [Candidatus Omnitrophota bacterium]
MMSIRFISSERAIGAFVAGIIVCASLTLILMNKPAKKDVGRRIENQPVLNLRQPIDPALVLYKETSSPIHTGFSWARSIAVGPDDRIYVSGGQEIRAFEPSGERLPFAVTLQNEATALTVSKDGTLYAGAEDHIETYDSSGQLKERWKPNNSKSFITSIGVWEENVLAADFGARTVYRYDLHGNEKGSFGDFVLPSYYFDLAISPNGIAHVVNTGKHRVESYNPDGNLTSWWGEFSNDDVKKFCGCCNPVNFTLLPNDEGFVTCEKGITRVKVFDKEGTFLGFVAAPDQFSRHDSLSAVPDYCFSGLGLDVAIDSKGRILILDPALAQVRIFARI